MCFLGAFGFVGMCAAVYTNALENLQLIVIVHFQSLPFQKACQVGLSL